MKPKGSNDAYPRPEALEPDPVSF